MDVRSPKPSDTKHGVTQYFRFIVDMFLKFGVCMIGKNYCIVYLYVQTSQIDCFRRVHKILVYNAL